MAAGLVWHNITTASGVTFAVASWVPDTGSPHALAKAAHSLFDTAGNEILTAAQVVSLLGKLDTLHTDLGTTLAGYVDGLEALVGTTNSALTTLAGYVDGLEGYVDGLETLIGATNTALGGTIATAGTIAHDAADSGNPVKVGGKAVAGLSGQTLVAAADRSNLFTGLDGALYVKEIPIEDIIDGNATNTDGTITTVIAAGGANVYQYVCQAILANEHATTTAFVVLKSGTTARTGRLPVPPGGATFQFPGGLKPNAANEVWAFDPDAAVTTLSCTLIGFKSKVA